MIEETDYSEEAMANELEVGGDQRAQDVWSANLTGHCTVMFAVFADGSLGGSMGSVLRYISWYQALWLSLTRDSVALESLTSTLLAASPPDSDQQPNPSPRLVEAVAVNMPPACTIAPFIITLPRT